MQIAEVLAIESSKNVVALLFLIRNITQGSCITREFHAWKYTCWRICSNNTICSSYSYYWCMWPRFHVFKYLSIPKEWEYALLNNFLEDKVFVIVTEL